MASHRSRTMVAMLLIACLLQTAVAVEHIVGDADGWTYKPENFYDDWAKTKDIKVGDTLKFNWVSTHDVVQLSPTETAACDLTANAIEKWETPGVSIPLDTAGTFGYICAIPTHCTEGFMKMTVTVLAADDTPVASPPPPSTTASPPPPPSAASSLMQFYQPLMGALLAVFAAAAALYVY